MFNVQLVLMSVSVQSIYAVDFASSSMRVCISHKFGIGDDCGCSQKLSTGLGSHR